MNATNTLSLTLYKFSKALFLTLIDNEINKSWKKLEKMLSPLFYLVFFIHNPK